MDIEHRHVRLIHPKNARAAVHGRCTQRASSNGHTAPKKTETGHPSSRRITIWGLEPRDLFKAYWASRGVQCVTCGDSEAIDHTADLFLLREPGHFVFLDLAMLIDRIVWRGAHVTRVHLIESHDADTYSERIRFDDSGYVLRIDRTYKPDERRACSILITSRACLARLWMQAPHPRAAWRRIRERLSKDLIDHLQVRGSHFRANDQSQQRKMIDHLVLKWPDPHRSIDGIKQIAQGIWTLTNESPSGATLVGPLWLGRGRIPPPCDCIVGPDWREDIDETRSMNVSTATILRISHVEAPATRPRRQQIRDVALYPIVKRTLDVVISALLLILLFPLMLIIAAAVVIDNGLPVLFAHRRESLGGRTFYCLKFRTMRKDAERLVANLAERNQCDGPQVNIENDPRITRIGSVLRRFHLDELPQLWNVLKGEMSLVGPRPSPENENQCCPAWRELRLSVRPGMTGLWQLNRTRAPGRDFQEWIKYDIEYVRRASISLDLAICIRTAHVILFGR